MDDFAMIRLQAKLDSIFYQDYPNIISFAEYKIWRIQDFPDVPLNFRGDSSWWARYEWMKQEQARVTRMRRNARIRDEYKGKK